ncbi:hypothetical protein BD779DRAFT_1666757 [Infundibulicybe gibba]|nr:hypothetical protein BD779DRAFT_1666757 [Infundibulicybe gibba]
MPESPLPLDILIRILCQLAPSAKNDSVETLVAFLRTSVLFREAASFSPVWKSHYQKRYMHCVTANENERIKRLNSNWRMMYAERRRLDRSALEILESMVTEPDVECDYGKALVGMSFDIWDTLRLEAQAPVPPIFSNGEEGEEGSDGPVKPHAITRRFCATSVLEAISKGFAVALWGQFSLGNTAVVTFEDSHTALSCFFGESPFDIKFALDGLAHSCRDYLIGQSIVLDQNDAGYSVIDICLAIRQFMRSQGFELARPDRFIRILNSYPHACLTSHKQTIPLSLVYFFTSISHRLGIPAYPAGFPGRVFAHIPPLNPREDGFYLDISTETGPILEGEVSARLMAHGMPPSLPLVPRNGPEMLIRAAGNIFQAFREAVDMSGSLRARIALQTIACIYLLLPQEIDLPFAIMRGEVAFSAVDCVTFLPNTLVPLLASNPAAQAIVGDACRRVLNRRNIDTPRPRPHGTRAKYFVGLVIEHIRHHGIGCIIQWEPKCMASEEWIENMGVDRLKGGRDQPFYKVFFCDGTERYIAEVNIQPIEPTKQIVQDLFRNHPDLARLFEDVMPGSQSQMGRLVMSPRTQAAFPDDDRYGEKWVKHHRMGN